MSSGGSEGDPGGAEHGVAESLRAAVERTLAATAGSAASTRERAGELLDEVARRGRGAGAELARRGQDAGSDLARRGQSTRDELAKRLEALERRLAAIEEKVRRREGDRASAAGEDGAEDGDEGPS